MSKRISVLEDDESLRDLFKIMLEDEGYQVETFPTAEMFNDNLSGQLPDLFILDVRLPDGDGMQICAALGNDERTKQIPVIMMSAHRNFDRHNTLCKARVFIAKPFDIPSLIGTIADVVQG